MRTDVYAHEKLAGAAVAAARRPDGTVTDEDHLAAIDDASAHSVELRFGRELTEAELRQVTDAAFIEFDTIEHEREAEPHVVHEPETIESSTVRTYDPERGHGKPAGHDPDAAHAAYWEFVETVRRQSTTACPDCTRGLVSRGELGLICSSLAPRLALVACHPQCFVACGRPRP
jgi:hypothetical protein